MHWSDFRKSIYAEMCIEKEFHLNLSFLLCIIDFKTAALLSSKLVTLPDLRVRYDMIREFNVN